MTKNVSEAVLEAVKQQQTFIPPGGGMAPTPGATIVTRIEDVGAFCAECGSVPCSCHLCSNCGEQFCSDACRLEREYYDAADRAHDEAVCS